MTWKKKIKKLLPDKIVYGYEVIRTAARKSDENVISTVASKTNTYISAVSALTSL